MPENSGFSKNDYSNESKSIDVNRSNKIKSNEAIYSKDDKNVLSYSGYVSNKKNNILNFDYNTKTEIKKNTGLYSGDQFNKANCLLGSNYYYPSAPKLELNDKINILRDIINNKEDYNYLDNNDLTYLENLLLFLEREYFGKDYKVKQSEDLSNDKIDEKFFRNNIFTKEEALKLLESVIIEAYMPVPTNYINYKAIRNTFFKLYTLPVF